MAIMDNTLSYDKILKDIQNFRRAGTYTGDEFNLLDTPSNKYFKIFFYFGSSGTNNTVNSDAFDYGLLSPSWIPYYWCLYYNIDNLDNDEHANLYENPKRHKYGIGNRYEYGESIEESAALKRLDAHEQSLTINALRNSNSAWSYLMLNDEEERAEKLRKFIELLSNVNTHSPWYFSTITGIGEALDRKFVEEPKTDLGERKKISITCLPDAFDNRISTLLELYRDVTWSWTHKREVIPANLRKFDMAIYIFEQPDKYWHSSKSSFWKGLGDDWKDSLKSIGGGLFESLFKEDDDDHSTIGKPLEYLDNINTINYALPAYKMIEFHDCEFSYNSLKSGINEIDNATGTAAKYTINITYSDCYVKSFNDILGYEIGDVISIDSYTRYLDNKPSKLPLTYLGDKNGARRANQADMVKNVMYPHDKGWFGKLGEQLMTKISDLGNSALKKAALGNLYSFSLTKLRDQISEAINNPASTITTLNDYVKTGKQRSEVFVEQAGWKRKKDGTYMYNIHDSFLIPGLENARYAHDKFVDGHKHALGINDEQRVEKIGYNDVDSTVERGPELYTLPGFLTPGVPSYDTNMFDTEGASGQIPEARPGEKQIGSGNLEKGVVMDNNIFDAEGASGQIPEARKGEKQIGSRNLEKGVVMDNNIFDNKGMSKPSIDTVNHRDPGDKRDSNIFDADGASGITPEARPGEKQIGSGNLKGGDKRDSNIFDADGASGITPEARPCEKQIGSGNLKGGDIDYNIFAAYTKSKVLNNLHKTNIYKQ